MTRGSHLLDALVDVVAEGGIAAVSVRSVAAAAGVSNAQVQYYFRTKDELLSAAYRHVADGLTARVLAVDLSGPPRDALRRVLQVWVPVDEARVRDARVWLTFAAAAPVSETLRPLSAALDAQLKAWLADFLRDALPAGRDAGLEAALLLAVLDGLVVQALVLPGPAGGELVAAGLDMYLDRLFPDPPGTEARRTLTTEGTR